MNPALESMLARYQCVSMQDYENALKEIIQEIALLGLWRAKFFEHAAFYGGTSLRILYQLNRFSEDLDFSLLKPQKTFDLSNYLKAIEVELNGMGFNVSVERKNKSVQTAVESAFVKAGTKEHLLKIDIPNNKLGAIQNNKVMSIKLEVDTDPPGGFETEAKTLLQPIPFAIRSYKEADLFAGKIHAILQRAWKSRVKGRDYYDFVWFIGRNTPVHLSHLEQRLKQSGGWTSKKAMQSADLNDLLIDRLAAIDIAAAKKDILPFLRDPMAVQIWSNEFFQSLLPQLKTI